MSKLNDKIATFLLTFISVAVAVLLFSIIGYILYHGLGVINWHFLTTAPTLMKAGGGIAPELYNSFMLLIISMIITIPFGLGAGIYLSEYAKDNKLTDIIKICIEALTSLPSIVVGLFGLLVFVKSFGCGFSILSGAMTLSILNVPVMTKITEDALRAVKSDIKEASLALGATNWQTITKVILTAALPNLITGVILTAGRVFGEAAALLYTAGLSTPILNFHNWFGGGVNSPLNPMRPGETLAVYIWKVNSEGLAPDARNIADGSAAVLILAVLLFNLLARLLGRIINKKLTGE